MIAAIDIIGDDRNDKSDCDNVVVSIYFEWPIYEFICIKGNISVAQIGENLINNKRYRLFLPFLPSYQQSAILETATAILSTSWCFIYWEDDCK